MADIKKFMEAWGIASDEVWQVSGGRAWAVKHSALERVADQQGIWFEPPVIVEKDALACLATVLVTAHNAHGVKVWSFGECSPANYKVTGKQPAYPWAMAEKRAKDRCILKLLAAHGTVYSEEEAEEFKHRATAPEPNGGVDDDYAPPGEPLDAADAEAANVIPVDMDADRKSAYHIKSKRPNDWPEVVGKLRAAKTREELKSIGDSQYVKEMTRDWPLGFLDELRSEYASCLKALKPKLQAAE